MNIRKFKWWSFWGEHFVAEAKNNKNRQALNLGSGLSNDFLAIKLDINPKTNPDILWDLNSYPWPLKDESQDIIYMMSLLEHLDDPLRAIKECYRILSPNGLLYILAPHFSSTSSYADLTHKNHFSAQVFDHVCPGSQNYEKYGYYTDAKFRIRKRIVELNGLFFYIPLLPYLVNKYLRVWEDYFCYLVRGAGIYIVLEKI